MEPLAKSPIARDSIGTMTSKVEEANGMGQDHIEYGDLSPNEVKKVEKKVILKQDFTVVLLLAGCAFFNFLDRAALGNARLMGFQKDLKLTQQQFFNCLMMVYVGYMTFELPAALALRVVPPPFLYGSAVMAFGVIAACTSLARSYAAVIVLRLFLGFTECFVQTGFVFLSLFYTHKEMSSRCAFFFGAIPLAGAFSGLIAYGVQKNMNGLGGKTAWEWFFIIEGSLTIFWGLLVFVILPRLPETIAKRGSWLFRTKAEHAVMMYRLVTANNAPNAKPNFSQIWLALRDVKTWLGGLVIGGLALNIAAFSAFLPTFIHEFGFSPLRSQLMSMIPYLLASVTLPAVSMYSDKLKKKAVIILACFCTDLVGFIMVLASADRAVGLVGCSLIAMASYPGLVIAASWQMQTHAGFTKRATAWGVSQVFIQSWSIISSQVYDDPPRFFKGHGVLLGLNAVGLVAGIANYYIMKRSNVKKEQRALEFQQSGQQDPDNDKSYEELQQQIENFPSTGMPVNSVDSTLRAIATDPSKVLGLCFGGQLIQPGQYLSRGEAKSIPDISFTVPPSRSETTYMLVGIDLDAPFPSFDRLGPILHVIQPGYRRNPQPTVLQDGNGGDMLTTKEPFVANYIGPAPPPLSSPHRYYFLLYEQPTDFQGATFAPADGKRLSNWYRMRFDLDAWEKKARLGPPVAANYFRSN